MNIIESNFGFDGDKILCFVLKLIENKVSLSSKQRCLVSFAVKKTAAQFYVGITEDSKKSTFVSCTIVKQPCVGLKTLN